MSQLPARMGAPAKVDDATQPPRAAFGCGAVAIVALLVGGLLLWYIISTIAHSYTTSTGELRKFAADIARPKITINEIVVSTVDDVHHQNKLVVLNAKLTADVTREEGSSSWGVYWGTNVARVMATDAHAQYYINLSQMSTADFVYDESAKKLTVSVPRPVLDTTMISIDPTKIQTLDLRGGWALWNKEETREHAVAELIPKVIMEASTPLVKKEADEAGREAMLTLLHPLADTLAKDGVELEIRYRD